VQNGTLAPPLTTRELLAKFLNGGDLVFSFCTRKTTPVKDQEIKGRKFFLKAPDGYGELRSYCWP
jgi:hypothetical protein